jgi:hypothetical protein
MIASLSPADSAPGASSAPRKRNRKGRSAPGEHKWRQARDRVREWVFLTPASWVKLRRGMRLRHYHTLAELLEQLAQRWGAEDGDLTTPLEDTIRHLVGQGVQTRRDIASELQLYPRPEIDAWVDSLVARGLLEEVFERAQGQNRQTSGAERQKLLILPQAPTGDGYQEQPGESGVGRIARENG